MRERGTAQPIAREGVPALGRHNGQFESGRKLHKWACEYLRTKDECSRMQAARKPLLE
jgi:hypothetical protein